MVSTTPVGNGTRQDLVAQPLDQRDSITPAFGMALREVRERPDELRRILAGGDGPGA